MCEPTPNQSKGANPVAVAIKKRGSDHWILSMHSGNIQCLRWRTSTCYRTSCSPKSSEDKRFLLMLILSALMSFPSFYTNLCCIQERNNKGWDQGLPVPLWTKDHSYLSEYASGHSGVEGLNFFFFLMNVLDTATRSPFPVDPLIEFGEFPNSNDGCGKSSQWKKGNWRSLWLESSDSLYYSSYFYCWI